MKQNHNCVMCNEYIAYNKYIHYGDDQWSISTKNELNKFITDGTIWRVCSDCLATFPSELIDELKDCIHTGNIYDIQEKILDGLDYKKFVNEQLKIIENKTKRAKEIVAYILNEADNSISQGLNKLRTTIVIEKARKKGRFTYSDYTLLSGVNNVSKYLLHDDLLFERHKETMQRLRNLKK